MEEDEEDPFGAFGGSDSSDDDDGDDQADGEENNEEATKKAKALMQAVNNINQHNNGVEESKPTTIGTVVNKPTTTTTTSSSSTTATEVSKQQVVDLSNLAECTVESFEDPLYLSSGVKLVSSLPFGGGRGYVALKDLRPGTLIMVEEAIMTWPDEQLGKALTLSSVHRLLRHPNASKVIHCLEDFHPTKEVVDANVESESPDQVESMLESLLEKYQRNDDDEQQQQLDQIVKDAQTLHITNRNGSAISPTDILRIFLALRYNGLESGLYCHVAMLNHQCQPNCVKFLPNNSSSSSSSSGGGGNGTNKQEKSEDLPEKCSEVRTTRWVKAGQSLSISYMPKIVSHASRRQHLWDQHRFDIGVEFFDHHHHDDADDDIIIITTRRMELIHGGLPPSSKEFVNNDSITSRVEKSINDLGGMYQFTKESLADHHARDSSSSSSSCSPTTDDSEAAKAAAAAAVEQAKALEVSSLELFLEAKRQLQNDNHLLLIPCLVLHLDACNLLLQEDIGKPILSHTQRCKLLSRTVGTALNLLELQQAHWGRDHFDVARTNLDLAQAIQELLSNSPDHLLNLETTFSRRRQDLKSFRDWAALEYKCQKDYERIKEMYPRDASKYITKTS